MPFLPSVLFLKYINKQAEKSQVEAARGAQSIRGGGGGFGV